MYTRENFHTKKALRLMVDRRRVLCDDPVPTEAQQKELNWLTQALTVFQPNGDLTGTSAPRNGRVALEGPHYPAPHRWYASAQVEDGVVVKVS